MTLTATIQTGGVNLGNTPYWIQIIDTLNGGVRLVCPAQGFANTLTCRDPAGGGGANDIHGYSARMTNAAVGGAVFYGPTNVDLARWATNAAPAPDPAPAPAPGPTVVPAPAPTTPSISASPNPITNVSTTGTTTITFNTGDGTDGRVWVTSTSTAPPTPGEGGPTMAPVPVLFASGASGSATATWVRTEVDYRFTLYKASDSLRQNPLASVTVTATAPPVTNPTITASPNPIPAGSGSGSSTISWSTGNSTAGQVWLSVNGAAEVLFDNGTSGSGVVPWFNAGNSYRFTLYTGTTRATQLAQVTVTRAVTTGSISATPATTGTTTINFDTNGNGDTGVVYVSINGGTEFPVWQNPRGVQSATWIDPGNTYVFRLYAGQGRLSSGVLASVTVTR